MEILKKMCKISLIIPVYNSEKFLEKLFDSIINQTYDNYEVIIVNDGSTDNSINIIEEYMKDNEKIKSVTIQNSGPGVARKIGFQNATGDLLYFIDSDDYLFNNNVLERIAYIYKENKFDMLFFDFVLKYKNTEKNSNTFYDNKLKKGFVDEKYIKNNKMAGALWEKIFVKNMMSEEQFCDANNYEDYYTTYKYLNNCKKFYYIDEPFYISNRDNENSISKKVDTGKVYRTVELLKKTYKETSYKYIFSKIMFEYYLISRRKLDDITLTKKEKKESIRKLKELKKYFSFFKILKFKISLKQYLKYAYYGLADILI